jgi:hypothetical protein
MRAFPCVPGPHFFFCVLGSVILIGALVGTSPPPKDPELTPGTRSRPEPRLHETERLERPLPPPQKTENSPEYGESPTEQVIEALLLILILVPVLGLLFAFPATLLAVSLVMDGGCLRYILFGFGWIFAITYGLIFGAIVGEEILGLEFLVEPIGYTFMWGYPVAAWWGNRKLQSMRRERYRAWEQTLTGGALLGFGVGSVANLLRSIFTLKGGGFGGVGGGSFGGSGASGSWSGASGAAGSVSSSSAGTATTAAQGTAQAAATAAVPSKAAEASPDSSADASPPNGFWERLRHRLQKFQWYHGVIFAIAALVFVPLGLGTMQALQNRGFLIFVLVCTILYGGVRFLRRNPEASKAAFSTIPSFGGGEASSSWS